MPSSNLWKSAAAKTRYAHVDALRAAAVLLVVVSHAGLQDRVPGAAGVTIFLAISGFIITYLVLREREATGSFSAGRFYLRRALKIGPPFLAIILIPTAFYAAVGGAVDGRLVLEQTFFVVNWPSALSHPGRAGLPGSGVLWSLSVEEQFYIAFALFWLFASRSRHYLRYAVGFGAAAIVASFAVRLLVSDGTYDSNRINYGTDTRMESIGWGVLTAVLFICWQHQPNRWPGLRRLVTRPAVPALAAGLFLASLVIRNQLFRDTFRFTLQSLCAVAVILFGLLAQGRMQEGLQRLARSSVVWAIGLASYSVYLVHDPLYEAAGRLTGHAPAVSTAPLFIVVGVVVGVLIYRVVEVPFENVRMRLHRTARELPGSTVVSGTTGRPRPEAAEAAAVR